MENTMADEETGAVVPESEVESTPAPEAQQEAPAVEAAETPEGGDGPPAEAADGAQAEEQPKPAKKTHAYQTRIDELTKIRRELERENADLKAARQQPEQPDADEDTPATQADFEALVVQKAAELDQQRQMQGRMNTWLKAGHAEFAEDFDDRCNTVASLGAAERPEFMQIVTDPDIIQDGHKLVAALADDPTEAMRILALPPVQMSAALVKYASKIGTPKTKALSSAPAPIKPLDGTSRGSDEPTDRDSEDEWFRKREAQLRERAQTGARF
jgi:hypothetical protein